MSQAARDRIVIAALVTAESSWIYVLLGMVGLALGTDGSPLGWPVVLSLLAAAAALARLLSRLTISTAESYVPATVARSIQVLSGAVGIYLAVSTQVGLTDALWDLDWPGVVAAGSDVAGANFRATVGAIAGVALWWRGGQLGSGEEPAAALERSYKAGTVLMVIAVVVDIGTDASLGTFGAMFVLFAAALGGLGVARLGREGGSGASGPWLKAVGATVAGVLAIGFAFSLVRRSFLDAISAPVNEVLGWMGTAIFYALIVPVAWVINGIVRAFVGLFAGGEPGGEVIPLGESIGEQFLQRQSEQAPAAYVSALEWLLLALLCAAGLYILSRALRRRVRGGGSGGQGVRESLREEADPLVDAADLLLGLLPAGLRNLRNGPGIVLPAGPPGVVGALRCYYRLLLHAGSLGGRRPPSATPREYAPELDGLVPGGIAQRATAAFDEALYGGREQPEALLGEMDGELDRLGAPRL